MIKNILFDCGGVFVDIQYEALMRKITGDPELAARFTEMLFSDVSPWTQLYDKGDCDTEGCRALLQKQHPEIRPEYLRQFMEEWIAWLPTFPEMETIIPELHAAGRRCFLLSNFPHRFDEFRRRYCPALQDLDGAVISYQIHLLKPDPRIFTYTAGHLGIEPAETLFIDDSSENVDSARSLGFQAWHYTSAVALRAELARLGVLP